jgi:Tfp pilus assembly protein PilF
MTDAIISDLSRIKALRVISRTSAMKYKDSSLSIPEIARELNVDAVLEGSALLVGDSVRVSVQLISGRHEETLWSDRYDRNLENVFALQAELAQTVAKEIAIQLTPAEARQLAATRVAVNAEAHVEYLKSRHSSFSGSREGVEIGIRHAKRALEIDPEYALAWAALADCNIFKAVRGMAPPAAAAAEAMVAARRALELNPTLADAHCSIGIILCHTGKVAEGLASLEKAIELNPGLAIAHTLVTRAYFAFERHSEALESAQKAISLDPLSVLIHTALGDALYFAREYEKSALAYRMSIELDWRFDGAHTDLARSLEALGRFDEARVKYEEGRRISSGVAGPSIGMAQLEASAGNEAEARRLLAELIAARESRVISAWGIASVHACLGDVDEAFRWLDIAVEEKASGLLLLRVHPRLDPIRNDPRYLPLVKKVGLADPG